MKKDRKKAEQDALILDKKLKLLKDNEEKVNHFNKNNNITFRIGKKFRF